MGWGGVGMVERWRIWGSQVVVVPRVVERRSGMERNRHIDVEK